MEGINTAEAVIGHFRNILLYIQSRKDGLGHEALQQLQLAGGEFEDGRDVVENESVMLFSDVEVAGPLLKLPAGRG